MFTYSSKDLQNYSGRQSLQLSGSSLSETSFQFRIGLKMFFLITLIQYLTKVSTSLTFQQPFYYILSRYIITENKTWIYFSVVSVQLV